MRIPNPIPAEIPQHAGESIDTVPPRPHSPHTTPLKRGVNKSPTRQSLGEYETCKLDLSTSPGCRSLFAVNRAARAFTLLEVMIACGIFFMATFAILALVAGTLRNARALQRGDVDAGMAAAQIVPLIRTNRQTDITGSGDFGDAYPDYSYEFQSGEYMTNGLLQVDILVRRKGLANPVDTLSIWVYAPDAKSGFGAHL